MRDAITSVLVANRGEIARRVFASCARAGISTVAVYSDPDSNSPHVAEADVAVHLPGRSSAETYLRGDLIIAAALASGADAIHPGYGFLSENAEFAQAVQNAGLTWIGPPTKSIELMGSKVESKKIMADAGVPVLTQLEPGAITEAELPVLIKASSGGGGRGMRVVRQLGDLNDELDAARREAKSAFGDDTVFCERYIETGRHIEVQVMADSAGTVWALGERECSIQRRHQKVVEEAPSPLVEALVAGADPGLRDRLFAAAVIAAEAIGYEGAGTVEFLADERGNFFFLEMNTRLQVEHPVTECTTGLDLVALQLAMASGELLHGDKPHTRGHSIEVRLYAEDPGKDWQPQSGTIHKIALPGVVHQFTVLDEIGIRLDSGIVDGGVVGTDYDPMLAKVISFAPTRAAAAQLLASTLARTQLHGMRTNRDLLVNVLRHSAFRAGETDTSFFDKHGLDLLAAPLADADAERVSALAAALADAAHNRDMATVAAAIPSGWRNLASAPQHKEFSGEAGVISVDYFLTRGGLRAEAFPDVRIVTATSSEVVLDTGGLRRRFAVSRYKAEVFVDSALGPVRLTMLPRFTEPTADVAAGSLLAPMPGNVIRVAATQGDVVAAGQIILVLEAMKMEHSVTSPAAGVLAELNVAIGQQVEVGSVLAVVTAQEEGQS